MASMQLPIGFSDKTILLKLSAEEVGNVLSSVIDVINHGLDEPIDKLAREELKR